MQVTLTTKNGQSQALSLPLQIGEVMKKPVPYFLTYGKASITFDTPNTALNQALERCLPAQIAGGVRELSLLAFVLDKMNEEQQACFAEYLPEEPCGIEEITQCTCSPSGYQRLQERHTQSIRAAIDQQRMTGGELFQKIMECARDNGDLARFDTILEYVLPEDYDKAKLCSYEFDFLPAINFGGSEGIYIDCSIRGKFDDSGRKSLCVGTIKTLSTDLDACKIMGELCGALMYHESRYVNDNLYRFDSAKSLESLLTRPMAIEPVQAEGPQMGGQQM